MADVDANCTLDPEVDSGEVSDEEEPYCFCGEPNNGIMIACDGPTCEYEWWHTDCAGFREDDIPENEWICPECTKCKPTRRRRTTTLPTPTHPVRRKDIQLKDHGKF